MNRHDLAFLKPQAQVQFLDRTMPEHVRQKLFDLLNLNVPLTVCRQDHAERESIKLAMCCFVNGTKYRMAVYVSQQDILKITPPVPLKKLIDHLSKDVQRALLEFEGNMQYLSCAVYVYGSYAYQYLTDETYINSSSDLDIVLYPKQLEHLPQILSAFRQLKQCSNIRMDGEIKIHPEWHVSLNEFDQIYKQKQQQIIAKGIRHVQLIHLNALLNKDSLNAIANM